VRNPLKEQLFHWELPGREGGIHPRNGYSARNYKHMDEESIGGWDSAGNYLLIDEESARGEDSSGNYHLIDNVSDR
jgi:hypothetical protein